MCSPSDRRRSFRSMVIATCWLSINVLDEKQEIKYEAQSQHGMLQYDGANVGFLTHGFLWELLESSHAFLMDPQRCFRVWHELSRDTHMMDWLTFGYKPVSELGLKHPWMLDEPKKRQNDHIIGECQTSHHRNAWQHQHNITILWQKQQSFRENLAKPGAFVSA